ncbi:MAG: NAD(P)H-dependent oxidoreductase subunit E [Deltaproteobacteria bacterium]|jgi:NADH-quinone oxidoreductase subunit E|nr:NAD(P)H-dependent oxidoreductase subunit E [Deltaproteobacteria bacterium]
MAETQMSADGLKSLARYMDQFEDKESAIIKVLYEAQHIFGYLSNDVMLFIAEKMDIPAAKIFGVVSFYSYFTTTPRGRCQIKACMGTACFVRGSEKVVSEFEKQLNIKRGQTSDDLKYSLDVLRCVGACGLAPVIVVNDKVYGKATAADVSKIINEIQG